MREPSTGKLSGGGHPVGESQNQLFQLSFNRFLRVDFQGSRVTSDGGLILVRELDERFGLSKLIGGVSGGFAHGTQPAVPAGRPAAAIGLQPAGGLRRPERCGPAVDGPNLPADGFEEGLGAGCTIPATLSDGAGIHCI